MAQDEYKNCPYCDEEIKAIAVKCRYCKSMLIIENDYPQKASETLDKDKELDKKLKAEHEKQNNIYTNDKNKVSKVKRKNHIGWYILAGFLFLSLIGMMSSLNTNSSIDIDDVGSDVSDDGSAEDNSSNIDDVQVDSNIYDVESLTTADSFQRSLAKQRIDMVYTYNQMGLNYWQSFINSVTSGQQPQTVSSQVYVEHLGEVYSDYIYKYVLPILIESEDSSKRNTNEVWRNEVVQYYFNSSIEVNRLKIAYIQNIIEYYWTGDEELLNDASYYENVIYTTHENLYEIYIILSEALSEANYEYLIGVKVFVDVGNNELLLVKEKPGVNFNTIDKLQKGVELEVTNVEAGEWLAVKYRNDNGSLSNGYVNGAHVTTSQDISKAESSIPEKIPNDGFATQVYVDVDVLRLRSGSGTNYDIIDRLEKGTILEVIGEKTIETGEIWLQVITPDGKEGWVHSDYVR